MERNEDGYSSSSSHSSSSTSKSRSSRSSENDRKEEIKETVDKNEENTTENLSSQLKNSENNEGYVPEGNTEAIDDADVVSSYDISQNRLVASIIPISSSKSSSRNSSVSSKKLSVSTNSESEEVTRSISSNYAMKTKKQESNDSKNTESHKETELEESSINAEKNKENPSFEERENKDDNFLQNNQTENEPANEFSASPIHSNEEGDSYSRLQRLSISSRKSSSSSGSEDENQTSSSDDVETPQENKVPENITEELSEPIVENQEPNDVNPICEEDQKVISSKTESILDKQPSAKNDNGARFRKNSSFSLESSSSSSDESSSENAADDDHDDDVNPPVKSADSSDITKSLLSHEEYIRPESADSKNEGSNNKSKIDSEKQEEKYKATNSNQIAKISLKNLSDSDNEMKVKMERKKSRSKSNSSSSVSNASFKNRKLSNASMTTIPGQTLPSKSNSTISSSSSDQSITAENASTFSKSEAKRSDSLNSSSSSSKKSQVAEVKETRLNAVYPKSPRSNQDFDIKTKNKLQGKESLAKSRKSKRSSPARACGFMGQSSNFSALYRDYVRIERNMKELAKKNKAHQPPKDVPYRPYTWNRLGPYYNLDLLRYVIHAPITHHRSFSARATARGVVDPETSYQMDVWDRPQTSMRLQLYRMNYTRKRSKSAGVGYSYDQRQVTRFPDISGNHRTKSHQQRRNFNESARR